MEYLYLSEYRHTGCKIWLVVRILDKTRLGESVIIAKLMCVYLSKELPKSKKIVQMHITELCYANLHRLGVGWLQIWAYVATLINQGTLLLEKKKEQKYDQRCKSFGILNTCCLSYWKQCSTESKKQTEGYAEALQNAVKGILLITDQFWPYCYRWNVFRGNFWRESDLKYSHTWKILKTLHSRVLVSNPWTSSRSVTAC